jgi:hypothetical protein
LCIDQLKPLGALTLAGNLAAAFPHQPFGAFKQVLEEVVTLGLLDANPCARIKNRRTKLGGNTTNVRTASSTSSRCSHRDG